MANLGLRVAVVGATGAVGAELISVLAERRFPVSELIALATEHSVGEEIEFRDTSYCVELNPERIGAADVAFFCTPPGAALEMMPDLVERQVPCFDLSGALSHVADVPLLAADLEFAPESLRAPVVEVAGGPALAWALALAPLDREVGLRRIQAQSLEAASGAGRRGIESLSAESIALFNQRDLPDTTVFDRTVAFDCIPLIGESEDNGATRREIAIGRDVGRLLGTDVPCAVQCVRVPTFSGDGASLTIETQVPLSLEVAADLLRKAPGVDFAAGVSQVPTTRMTTGREAALVGRLRADPTGGPGVWMWIASDALRLTAVNAVRLAEARREIA